MFTLEELEIMFDMLSFCCTEHPNFAEDEREREQAVIEKVYNLIKSMEVNE